MSARSPASTPPDLLTGVSCSGNVPARQAVSAQTQRNRVRGARKAAATRKALARARLDGAERAGEDARKSWPDMSGPEKRRALKEALAGGAPIDPGVTRGTARGDYSIAEIIARIRSREAALRPSSGQAS